MNATGKPAIGIPAQRTVHSPAVGHIVGRVSIHAVLIVSAVFFVAPLLVMLTTSLKPLDEIRNGTLVSLPHAPTLLAWWKAWTLI